MRKALCLLLLLAACADPRAACIADAQADVATLDRLIAESRANLERGYTFERQAGLGTGVRVCTRTGVAAVCAEREGAVEDRPVAIDTAAERAKLASLQESRRLAALRADQAIAACEARFPGR
jgi:hypothetical protein